MPVRRTAQAILAIIAVLAAGAATFRYLDRGGELFGERIEVIPAVGPVGISPIVALRGFKTKTAQNIYMCVGATSELGSPARAR